MSTHDDVSRRLAAKMGPAVQAALEEHRGDFLNDLPVVERLSLRLVWPTVVRKVPVALDAGLDALLTEFGAMTARDLLTFLADHAASRGDRAAAARLRTDAFGLVVRS